MQRRRAAIAALAEREKLDAILVCGENRSGSGVGWLTGWPVTAEAVAVFDPARPGVLFVQYHNHVPLAAGKQRRLARKFDLVNLNGAYTLLRIVKSPGPMPDIALEAGMTIVLQPNVVTRDARAGVQIGNW
jgi:hypothetical protein